MSFKKTIVNHLIKLDKQLKNNDDVTDHISVVMTMLQNVNAEKFVDELSPFISNLFDVHEVKLKKKFNTINHKKIYQMISSFNENEFIRKFNIDSRPLLSKIPYDNKLFKCLNNLFFTKNGKLKNDVVDQVDNTGLIHFDKHSGDDYRCQIVFKKKARL